MKKLLVLSAFYRPFIGGAEISVEEIINRLSDKFNFVVLTTLGKKGLPRKEEINRIKIYRLGFGYKWDKYLYPLLAFIKSFSIDFDEVYAVMASYAGLGALIIKKLRGKPYILNLQSGTLDKKENKLKAIHQGADRIIAISNSLKDRALRLGVKAEKITIVPNGVDLEKFKVLPLERNNLRIIVTARLEEVKGVDCLIKAMPSVLEKYPKAELLIIGDGNLRRQLENLAEDLKIKDRVTFLGAVDHNRLPLLLNSGNIFVCPSRAEGFGIACVEAMACGLAVIATRVGGIPDIIEDKVNGLLVESENWQVIGEKIIFLLGNTEVQQKLVANAQKSVQDYGWDNISHKIADLL